MAVGRCVACRWRGGASSDESQVIQFTERNIKAFRDDIKRNAIGYKVSSVVIFLFGTSLGKTLSTPLGMSFGKTFGMALGKSSCTSLGKSRCATLSESFGKALSTSFGMSFNATLETSCFDDTALVSEIFQIAKILPPLIIWQLR